VFGTKSLKTPAVKFRRSPHLNSLHQISHLLLRIIALNSSRLLTARVYRRVAGRFCAKPKFVRHRIMFLGMRKMAAIAFVEGLPLIRPQRPNIFDDRVNLRVSEDLSESWHCTLLANLDAVAEVLVVAG
jgi:hypothetical protein